MTKRSITRIDEASSFLVKRGLTRDRANYVSMLVKFRAEAAHLRKYTKDADILEMLDGICEIIGCDVEDVYAAQAEAEQCQKT